MRTLATRLNTAWDEVTDGYRYGEAPEVQEFQTLVADYMAGTGRDAEEVMELLGITEQDETVAELIRDVE